MNGGTLDTGLDSGASRPAAMADEDRADALLRAGAWRLLAALLTRPPAEALLAQLRQLPGPDEGTAGTAIDWRILRDAAGRVSAGAADDEFHALFIGLGRGELVPYGSWYLSGMLMDKPLAMLRRDLQALGLARREAVREPEDHAGALCDAMALLIEDATPGTGERQRAFLDAHLAPWLGRLFGDMQSAAAADFYRGVGAWGAGFMAFEREYLDLET